ncbi:hypothetical protein AAGF08_06365 [Algoriphagus sp. SE2]|uniref:hypothetical protein n=1 Tax=Algoriphagus sp. SE2 TaxID=3141536 RepID=UPI0031CCE24E
MKITSPKGNFKIIQTIKNRDELLILGSWTDIVGQFESDRTFLVNKAEGLFGIYLSKQECNEFINQLMMAIDYNEWEDFRLEEVSSFNRYIA